MSEKDGERFADDAHRYRLDSRIATGGMGEVWRATDTLLGRTVAVKLLKHEYADDPRFRTRFESEARNAGSLTHAGVAGVFDFGEGTEQGSPRPFLVMEHVDGQPLSALLRPSSPMDADVARDLLAQVGDALGAAHQRGIVHRDVKPANLIVTPDRRVKVTDFGIARAADGVALTETGQVMGTPHYLSPEQARGDTATAASDVYALGVVAFQCLVGRNPFRGDSSVTIALAHLRDPVPELPADVPADLARVVRRALAKNPAERFADGAAFAAAMRDPTSEQGAVAAPETAPTQSMAGDGATAVLPTSGAGLAAAGLAGAAAGAAVGGGADAQTPGDPGTSEFGRGPETTQIGTGERTVSPGESKKRWGIPSWLPWLLLVLVLAVVVWLVVRSVAGGGDDPSEDPEPTPTATATATVTAEPTETSEPEPTEEPEPETIDLNPDDYLGRDIGVVQQELTNLGLEPSSEAVENDGSQTEGAVASIAPTTGLSANDPVALTYYDEPAEPEDEETEDEGSGDGSGGDGSGGGAGGSGTVDEDLGAGTAGSGNAGNAGGAGGAGVGDGSNDANGDG